MKNSKFSKPPLSKEEKEKKADAFINFSDKNDTKESLHKQNIKKQKEKMKAVFLRAPESLYQDIQEIIAITGLPMNSICLELLRPAIKKKLKDLKES